MPDARLSRSYLDRVCNDCGTKTSGAGMTDRQAGGVIVALCTPCWRGRYLWRWNFWRITARALAWPLLVVASSALAVAALCIGLVVVAVETPGNGLLRAAEWLRKRARMSPAGWCRVVFTDTREAPDAE